MYTTASKIASLESEAAALRTQAESLDPWLKLDIPLEQLSFTETTRCHVGFLPEKELPEFQKAISSLLADVSLYGLTQDGQAMVILAYEDADNEVKHLLKEHDFSEAVLPKRSGLAADVRKELLQEAEEKESRITRLKEETRQSIPQKQQVELYYDQLNAAHDRLQNGGVETVSAFKVQGQSKKRRDL